MDETIDFKCTYNGKQEIPQAVIDQTGLGFPEVHTRMDAMAELARAVKRHHKDIICHLPFCATVEAEAMGAQINLGDEKNGPRVRDYAYTNMESLAKLGPIDLSGGRIRQVLDAVEYLTGQGEVVALNVEGPLTIASSLVDPRIFYKGLRKDKTLAEQFLKMLEDNIVAYAKAGISSGAKIISYADPAGALDIVGPKVFGEVCATHTCRILKRLKAASKGFILHLCGKTSTALEKLDFIRSAQVSCDMGLTYGEAMINLLERRQDILMIGHNCIKRTPFKRKKPVLWQMSLPTEDDD